eukprot:11692480-Heterocapsa_arctica.AAC.1
MDAVSVGDCLRTLDTRCWHMLTRKGQHLATRSNVCRVTQVCDEPGVVMVTDPVNCNYGFVHLPDYMFDIVT